jgi:hypothetical protein
VFLSGLHFTAWEHLLTVDIPLLPGSHPCRLVAISHQPPTLLTLLSQNSLQTEWFIQLVLVTQPWDGPNKTLFLAAAMLQYDTTVAMDPQKTPIEAALPLVMLSSMTCSTVVSPITVPLPTNGCLFHSTYHNILDHSATWRYQTSVLRDLFLATCYPWNLSYMKIFWNT